MRKSLVLYQPTVPASEQMRNATPERAKAGMDTSMSWAEFEWAIVNSAGFRE